MFHAQTVSAGFYYSKFGFKSPRDAKNCPFTFAHDAKDASFFDLIETMPDRAALFNTGMTAKAVLVIEEIVALFAFNQLEPNTDGIVLVDVGGGKGHVINAIQNAFPDIKGKIVLEDLKSVLDGGTVVSNEDVAVQPYDFFEEQQPIRGKFSEILRFIVEQN
jgi:hypothetical protein